MRNSVYIHFNIYIYISINVIRCTLSNYVWRTQIIWGSYFILYIYIYIHIHNIIPMIVLYVINMYIYAEHACCMSSICIYIYIYIQNMHISHSIHHRHGPIPSRWEPWPMANHSHSQITLWWSNVEMGHPSFIDISRLSFQQTTLPFTLWLWLT